MECYYVVAPELGSCFGWADRPPFDAYGAEAQWSGNWLEKLTRSVYLAAFGPPRRRARFAGQGRLGYLSGSLRAPLGGAA